MSNNQHPAACPCPECKKACERATRNQRESSKDSGRVRNLSIEKARKLGYVK